MKRFALTLIMVLMAVGGLKAMSYEEARDRAWFLTDKMAYELNLTPAQYDRAYQINLDYLMSVNTASDCFGYGWTYRDADLRCVLFDWQYKLYASLDYFFRPLRWVRSAWYYPVCDHYRRGYYYFHRPTVYASYRGGMWKRRGHNDVSPYRGMHFDRGGGMRDRYHSNHGRPDHRPELGRPGRPAGSNGRPAGGRYDRDDKKDNRPSQGRYDRDDKKNPQPGYGRPNRPSRGNNSGTRPSREHKNNGSSRSSHSSRTFGR